MITETSVVREAVRRQSQETKSRDAVKGASERTKSEEAVGADEVCQQSEMSREGGEYQVRLGRCQLE